MKHGPVALWLKVGLLFTAIGGPIYFCLFLGFGSIRWLVAHSLHSTGMVGGETYREMFSRMVTLSLGLWLATALVGFLALPIKAAIARLRTSLKR
jgi:hypothetical protein